MQKELLENDKVVVDIKYDADGWPLTFRPAGSPAGTWPHTPWWHSTSHHVLKLLIIYSCFVLLWVPWVNEGFAKSLAGLVVQTQHTESASACCRRAMRSV